MSGLLNPHRLGGDAPPAPTTWNPSDKSGLITLSGGNLSAEIAQSVFNFESVRATQSRSADKYYFEIQVNALDPFKDMLVGIATDDLDLASFVGGDLNSIGYYALNGNVYVNNTSVNVNAAYAVGDYIHIAVDFDNARIWFRKAGSFWNGSGTANPAANTGGLTITPGTYFPGWTGNGRGNPGTSLDKATANFGASAFNGTVPAGFTAWNG